MTGLVERQEVIAWADGELLTAERPDNQVIELSLSGRLPHSQLIRLLTSFSGALQDDLPVQLLLAHADQLLEQDPPRADELILGVRLLNAEEFISPHIRGIINQLRDAQARCRQGTLSQAALAAQLAQTLREFRPYRSLLKEL